MQQCNNWLAHSSQPVEVARKENIEVDGTDKN